MCSYFVEVSPKNSALFIHEFSASLVFVSRMMWAAGCLAAMSQITYPAISTYVSTHMDADQQGVGQGIVTGIRGLCTGLGPALYGFVFYMFDVDLNENEAKLHSREATARNVTAANSTDSLDIRVSFFLHFLSIFFFPSFLFCFISFYLFFCVNEFVEI